MAAPQPKGGGAAPDTTSLPSLERCFETVMECGSRCLVIERGGAGKGKGRGKGEGRRGRSKREGAT